MVEQAADLAAAQVPDHLEVQEVIQFTMDRAAVTLVTVLVPVQVKAQAQALAPVQAQVVPIYPTLQLKVLQMVLLENQDVMLEAFIIPADIGTLQSLMKMEIVLTAL